MSVGTAAAPRRAAVVRRILRDLSAVLITAGLLLVLDVAVTLLWQEPVTAVIALVRREAVDHHALSMRLSGLDRHALARLETTQQRIAFLARREERQLAPGDAVGRIVIPRIGVDFTVVQGTDPGSLEQGPGHYPDTALPGLGETVAIAGHRTTYLAPFRRLDELRPGDPIVLKMPYGTFTYVVERRRIVAPDDLGVVADVGYDRLVLSACHPLYSAAQRIIVFAHLQELSPAPTARTSN